MFPVLDGSMGDVAPDPKTSAPDGRGGIEIRDGGVAIILYQVVLSQGRCDAVVRVV